MENKQLVGVKFERLQLKALIETQGNPQHMNDAEFRGMVKSIKKTGWLLDAAVCWKRPDGKYQIISGHHRIRAAIDAGLVDADIKIIEGIDESQARLLVLEANQRKGTFDAQALDEFIRNLSIDFEINMDDIFDSIGIINEAISDDEKPLYLSLSEKFGVPPFSVVNARGGWWQDRKRAWISLGIKSELGRGEQPMTSVRANPGEEPPYRQLPASHGMKKASPGGSSSARLRLQQKAKGRRAGEAYKMKKSDSVPSNQKTIMNRKGKYKRKPNAILSGVKHPMDREEYKTGRYVGTKDKAKKSATATSYKSQGSLNAIMKQKMKDKIVLPEECDETSGTSIFDPVLCELIYRWFCPPSGLIIDPFAGGSVRGIVAAKLGRQYVGIDLSARQIEANEKQWDWINTKIVGMPEITESPVVEDYTPDITPIEQYEDIWIKREDVYCIGGGRGGKVRTCWNLAQGASGLITAGSRSSPQVNIVAQIAKKLGIPCRVHTPQGKLSDEVVMAREAGAEVVQHKAGYNNVIIARAHSDAMESKWLNIPFGMECPEAVEQTSRQVTDIPAGVKRIVIPVGSGMSLAGLLHGLENQNLNIPVVGVVVGANPEKRLDRYAPEGWRDMALLVESGLDYSEEVSIPDFHGIHLDPVYEAKCVKFLKPGDLFWIVGLRASVGQQNRTAGLHAGEEIAPTWRVGDSLRIDQICDGLKADMIFSCPPYVDLEVYSDDPRDISTMEYEKFKEVYFKIIKKSCALLKKDRFACFVVGEVRDKHGNYYGFVNDTIKAFEQAGLHYYNEIILVTAIGSLPIRIQKQFNSGRKIGKTHQNVLLFLKGDSKKATQDIGPVDFGDIEQGLENEKGKPYQINQDFTG